MVDLHNKDLLIDDLHIKDFLIDDLHNKDLLIDHLHNKNFLIDDLKDEVRRKFVELTCWMCKLLYVFKLNELVAERLI